MRDKARHSTDKVKGTLRNRSLRIGIGLAVLFAFGLMASGAFGDTFSVITTSTDSTASSDASTAPAPTHPSPTDPPSAPSPDTTATTDTSSSSTDTTSSPPAAGSVPYIVTFK